MRLKLLLLCSLLAAAVRSNQYTQDYKCTHDGFSTPMNTCQCTQFYAGKTCQQTQCVNSGVISPDPDEDNQRCACPPGFLGTHCEPVHCVPGDVKSFDEVVKAKSVAVIITYDTTFQEQFAKKDEGPDLIETICNTVNAQEGVTKESNIHFWFMQTSIVIKSKESCVEDVKNSISLCDEVHGNPNKPTELTGYSCEGILDSAYILGALDELGEDSRLLILANMGISDDNPALIKAIRKKAISLRIQIHSLVMSPRSPNANSVYFTGDYQRLRDLSESTLGFFINPFDASGGQKLGTVEGEVDGSGITEVLKDMMTVFFEYVVVDRITTNTTSCQMSSDFTVFHTVEENPQDFWLTVSSSKAPYSEYTTSWIGGPGVPIQDIRAGYFNAYKLSAVQGEVVSLKPYSIYGPNAKCVPSTVLVLARSAHLARFAITNSDNLDASSPYAISGGKNTLVGHFVKHYHEERLKSLYVEFSNKKEFEVQLDDEPKSRDCQYNAQFGEVVSCDDGDDTFIRVRDRDSGAAVTVQTLYCTSDDPSKVSSSGFVEMISNAEDDTDPAETGCKPGDFSVKSGKRALILAAHATQNIYQLFNGNKNSAIKYLNELNDLDDGTEDGDYYDQFILNIYNDVQETNAIVSEDYSDFKDQLMTQWHKYGDADEKTLYFDEECSADVSPLFPLEDIVSRFTKAHENSDVIFIFDRRINITDEDLMDLNMNLYQRRLRLVVLLLGCEEGDFGDSNELRTWNSIASATGGFAIHFRLPEDLNKFLENYVDWVKGENAAAMNAKINPSGFSFDPTTSTPFQANAGTSYKILVNSVPAISTVTLSNGQTLTASSQLGNSLSVFDYKADKAETLIVTATPSLYIFFASIRVIDLGDDLATIGFTESNCLEKAYPDFNPHDAQFPITFAEEGVAVRMTMFNSDGENFRTGDAKGTDGSFTLDYNWRCSDNQALFYVAADVSTAAGQFTRLFTTRCIGAADGIACLNGDPNEDRTECICYHEFTGDLCDVPVCQNGGKATTASECDCPAGYSGKFCESYLGCESDEAFVADFKSIATTVIFLVERSETVTEKLQLIDDNVLDNVRAAQYIVAQYGEGVENTVILSTTDKASLTSTLKGLIKATIGDVSSTMASTIFDPVPAMKEALQAQVTGSSHLFWFADSDSTTSFAEELFETIAHKRATISALFHTSSNETLVHPVALVGGTAFYDESADYNTFFSEYVAELMKYQQNFELRPNLLASSTACNQKLIVNLDLSTKKLFVAANGGTIAIDKDSSTYDDDDIPGGKVFTFKKMDNTKDKENKNQGAGQVTITITDQKKETYCSSSAVAFNQIQVAYGFVTSDESSDVQISAGKGEHLLVTYWTSESVEFTPTPTAIITPLSIQDGPGASVELFATVRGNCSFSLSFPINCGDGVDGYGVTISNYVVTSEGNSENKIDKYIPVICPNSDCQNGGTAREDGMCDCINYWKGDYCQTAHCVNGDVVGEKCVCYNGYSGDYCDDFTSPAHRPGKAFLFIQDVCGEDEDLKNTAESVFANYMSLMKTTTFYLSTNNENLDVVPVATVSDLTAQLKANRPKPGSCVASIGPALDKFYSALRRSNQLMITATADPIGLVDVAHVTTVAVDGRLGPLDGLLDEYTFTMVFVGMTKKFDYFVGEASFEDFPGHFYQTYDPEVALLDIIGVYPTDIAHKLPPSDYPRCIQNLQATFIFHNDISSVPKATEYRAKAQKVVQSVSKYFTIPDVKNIDIDDDTCEFNKEQERDKTLFSGSLYANGTGISTPTFCNSNMNSFPDSITKADYKQVSQVTMTSVIAFYSKWYATQLKMDCHCFDNTNENTTNIILWTPLSPTSTDELNDAKLTFDGFLPGNFHHIVLPFGFEVSGSALWSKLAEKERQNWLNDASKADYTVEQIAQDIWTIVCKLAGTITSDQTAEPFSYTTMKPRTGNGQNDDAVTDEPIGDSDPDVLPR